jgi:hypothetical protein
MTKVIIGLIQCLVLISMQMLSQISVYEGLNDEQMLKGHVEKLVHVKKGETPKELKTVQKKISKL